MVKKLLYKIFMRLTNLLFIKKIRGAENLPDSRFIVVANHCSYMDITIMAASFLVSGKKAIKFLAKKQLTKDTYMNSLKATIITEEAYPIYIDKDNPTKDIFDPAIRALKKGFIIGLYPEGGRTDNKSIKKGKTGMIRLALKAKCPIIPLGIKGTFEIMPKGKNFPKLKKIAEVNIGKPIYLNKYYDKKITRGFLRKKTDEIMEEIAKLSGKKYTPNEK